MGSYEQRTEDLVYVFSFLKSDTKLISVSNFVECSTVLMATNEYVPRFLFRIVHKNGSIIYENIEKFKHHQHILAMFTLPRQLFSLKCVMSDDGSGTPEIIRVYSRMECFDLARKGLMSSGTSLENEQALINWMRVCIGSIIQEPLTNFSSTTKVPGVYPLKITCSRKGGSKFTLPGKRTLAHEQRNVAQKLLDQLLNGPKSLHVEKHLHLFPEMHIDCENFEFQNSYQSFAQDIKWTPKASFFLYTKGCGRKRLMSAVFDAISSGALDCDTKNEEIPVNNSFTRSRFVTEMKEKYKILGKQYCPNLCVVVCSEQNLEKWRNEFTIGNIIIVKSKEDFSQLSYEKASIGGLLLLTPEALLSCKEESEQIIRAVRKISARDVNGLSRLTLDDTLCKRLHVSSIGQRMPNAPCPLEFLTPRCLVLDDVDLQNQEKNSVYREMFLAVSRIQPEWTWICCGFEGTPPFMIPPQWIERTELVLGIDNTLKLHDKRGLGSQILPSLFKAVHESTSGLIFSALTPKCLARKVTLISVKCILKPEESKFIAETKIIHIGGSTLPSSSSLINVTPLLLGAEVEGIAACTLLLSLERLQYLSEEEALKSCSEHFANGNRGTLAQRIKKEDNCSAGQAFVENSIKYPGLCSVCYTDTYSNISLCGHGYCEDCCIMQRKGEEIGGLSICAVCRASLSAYDWLKIESGAKRLSEPTKTNVKPQTSKYEGIYKVLCQSFGKRRHKRRENSITFVAVPDDIIDVAHKEISKWNKFKVIMLKNTVSVSFFDRLEGNEKGSVIIVGFSSLSVFAENKFFDDSVETVILACPPTSSSTYNQIIRASSLRSSPLPLFLLYAEGIENIDSARNILLHSSSLSPTR